MPDVHSQQKHSQQKPLQQQQLQRLREGLAQLQLQASSAQQRQMLEYLELLAKWTRAYNLTAVTDTLEMVSRHLLDSLSVAPWLEGSSFIDIGTGAGLPGIPLAILFPERHFTLLDSAGKRTRFLTQVQLALSLRNIDIVQSRVQNYVPAQRYDGILSRAFAALADMINDCKHLCSPNGHFYAMKAQVSQSEIAALPATVLVEQRIQLTVPFEPAARQLIVLKHK